VKGRAVLVVSILFVVALVCGYLVAANVNLLPEVASTRGELMQRLFNYLLGAATVVFVLVEGLLAYSVLRFRRRPGDDGEGAAIHGNTGLEVFWTAIPALLVVVIAVYSFRTLSAGEAASERPMVVEVIGRQFAWEFRYPEQGLTSSDLHLPVGTPVRFEITSEDVIHSFWVPNFLAKRDATPGQVSEFDVTPSEVGVFPVRCAELCGPGHAAMVSQVIVESPEAFEAWIERMANLPSDPTEAGRLLFGRYGCTGCHVLADAGASGLVGPSLEGLGARAGETVPGLDAEAYLRQSILEPKAHIVPTYLENIMPADFATRIPPQELDLLVTYLAGR
jgi:cytochrome c oxidase subunit 2